MGKQKERAGQESRARRKALNAAIREGKDPRPPGMRAFPTNLYAFNNERRRRGLPPIAHPLTW